MLFSGHGPSSNGVMVKPDGGGGSTEPPWRPPVTPNKAARSLLPYSPPIETVVVELTLCVVTVKVALVAPAGTVTLAGPSWPRTCCCWPAAPGALLAGAATFSVAVAVAVPPPDTLPGLMVTDCSAGTVVGTGLTVSVADALLEPRVAVIVTVVLAVTLAVLTVKFALVWSLLAVTEEGTEATDGLLLLKLIVAPAPGAGSLSWTVPDEPLVPVVAVGFSDTDMTAGGGSTCSVLDTEPVGRVAVIVTSVTAVTVPVVMLTLLRY